MKTQIGLIETGQDVAEILHTNFKALHPELYSPSMAAQIAATCKTCLNLECHCTCKKLQLSDIECSSDEEWLETEES